MHLPGPSQLHLWFTRLDEHLYDNNALNFLQDEEIKRAEKFRFSLHRNRFITARAALRSILSLYLQVTPNTIAFSQTPHGKLSIPHPSLHFNLSHSHDFAIYAFGCHMSIGIDLEKIRSRYNESVAKRFFSVTEYERFSKLRPDQQLIDFYRIWTGKEAMIKALGETLRYPLASFTIPDSGSGKILFQDALPEVWYLENVDFFPEYQSSVVTNQIITEFSFWEWTAQGEKKMA